MSRAYVPTAAIAAADPGDPNANSPADDRIYTVGRASAPQPTTKVAIVPIFTAGTAPTVSFTVWQRNGATGLWHNLGSFATQAGDDRAIVDDVRQGDDLFPEVTAIAGSPTDVALAFQPL